MDRRLLSDLSFEESGQYLNMGDEVYIPRKALGGGTFAERMPAWGTVERFQWDGAVWPSRRTMSLHRFFK
jgi:hypothetical protein